MTPPGKSVSLEWRDHYIEMLFCFSNSVRYWFAAQTNCCSMLLSIRVSITPTEGEYTLFHVCVCVDSQGNSNIILIKERKTE